jgi:hypothetical protein
VHSFATLPEDLATIAADRIQPAGGLAGAVRPHQMIPES